MHRSTASVLAGALALPLTVLAAPAAQADHRPKTVRVTVKTDAMPTRVQVTTSDERVACVRIATGAGRDRRVWMTLDGPRDTSVYTRLDARRTSRCLLAGAAAPRGARLTVRVEEDVPGPFNPRATATVRL